MTSHCYHFGEFELDCARFELRRQDAPRKVSVHRGLRPSGDILRSPTGCPWALLVMTQNEPINDFLHADSRYRTLGKNRITARRLRKDR
jgi:hypothetical protein